MTRREYHRLWARQKKARQLEGRRSRARTCPRGNGGGPCGGILVRDTDGHGHEGVRCPRCERRWAGICQDCPARVDGAIGKALRCARCKKVARRTYSDRYRRRNPEEYRAQWKRYHGKPAVRRRKADNLKLWRKLHPEKVKAQHRRSALRGTCREYQRRRRDAGYKAPTPPAVRTCVSCPTVVRGRVKKCALCREHDRLVAAEALAPIRGRGRRTDLEKSA